MDDMTQVNAEQKVGARTSGQKVLDRPISKLWCLVGWIGSTVVFMVLNVALGGPTEGDAAESVYSTWAIAHGHLACAYPPPSSFNFPSIADPFAFISPLYPWLTGGISAVLRIGHRTGFPSTTRLGANCSNAFVAMFHWSATSSAIVPTINLAYLVWPILLASTVAILRVTGRGGRVWEPVTLLILACSPPIVMCIVDFFHPQDVLAIALAFGAVAAVLHNRWSWAGILIGLALTAQPFALLVGAPLLVLAGRKHVVSFATSATAAVTVIDLPLIVLSSGRALKPSLLGSNLVAVAGAGFRSHGGTVLWETDVKGIALLFISRLLPVIGSMALAWWVSRRLGEDALLPANLMSLVTTSLSLRLIFEENMFGYYFMAVAVSLVVLDAVRGRFRGEVIAWIGLVSLAFNPVHWGLFSNWTDWARQLFEWLPPVCMAIVALIILYDATRGRFRWYLVTWLVLVGLTCEPQWWGPSVGYHVLPTWAWQVILVPTAVLLAGAPLRSLIGGRRLHRPDVAAPAKV